VIPLDDKAVGRRLGRSVRDAGGRVLLSAGTLLTPAYVESLRQRGYRAAYVVNELAPDVAPDESVREEAIARARRQVQAVMQRYARGRALEFKPLRDVVDSLIAELRGHSDLACSVLTLRSVDEYTFTHSVNVCVYSLIMGVALGYDRHDLLRLGVGALLHDIGKVNYADIISLPRRLTPEEFERIKAHTTDGYEILRHHQDIDIRSAHVAYQHHERLDGSGYPRGLRDESIIDYARIAAIADVYDAMTADRPHRGALPPHEAMAQVCAMAGEKLDPYLVRRFTERIAVFPTGSIVMLELGEIAVVVGQTGRGPAWPRVRVVTDRDQRLVEPREVEVGDAARIRSVLADYPSRVRQQLQDARRLPAGNPCRQGEAPRGT
jgi:putative nucleotidyltransferase with HDIG domain